MPQRIFDMGNEQDVRDLFNILPDKVSCIFKKPAKDRIHLCDGYAELAEVVNSIFNIKWGDKTSVDRPVDKSKWIGCLCFLSDCEENIKEHVDILTNIEDGESYKYYARGSGHYKYCRPVKRSEIKFVEDMEE